MHQTDQIHRKYFIEINYLDSIAIEVTSMDLTSIAVARPGTSLFTTDLVACHNNNQTNMQLETTQESTHPRNG